MQAQGTYVVVVTMINTTFYPKYSIFCHKNLIMYSWLFLDSHSIMLKLFRALFYQGLKGTMQLNYARSPLYIKQECVKLIITQQKMFAGVTPLTR